MELILKIGDVDGDSTYKDGDIVQAFSLERIQICHAEMKCHISNFPIDTVTGLRSNDTLLMKFMDKTHTYKFERLNSNEVKRENLETGAVDVLSDTPNERGEYISVHDYLAKKMKNQNHRIFGSFGSEIWYGKSRASLDINSIWNDIETHTDSIKSDHTSWPLTDTEKRHFLPLNACMHTKHDEHEHDHTCLDSTCSCTREECSKSFVDERNASVDKADGEDIILVAKRKFQVPYWDLSASLSINIDDVRDLNKTVDGRRSLDTRPAADLLTVDKVLEGIVIV